MNNFATSIAVSILLQLYNVQDSQMYTLPLTVLPEPSWYTSSKAALLLQVIHVKDVLASALYTLLLTLTPNPHGLCT